LQRSKPTIVPDGIGAKLLAAGPQRFGDAQVFGEIEHGTGRFHPPEELLSQMIGAVFLASLSQEEGKPALARVQFADIRDPYCRLEPREVTAEAVRKLAPRLVGSPATVSWS
jgi:hypothetical protein